MRIRVVVYNLELPCLVVVAIPGHRCYLYLKLYLCLYLCCCAKHGTFLFDRIHSGQNCEILGEHYICLQIVILGQFLKVVVQTHAAHMSAGCNIWVKSNLCDLPCNQNQIVLTCHVEHHSYLVPHI